MPQSIKIIFGLLGGLAIFIYGMNLMSETLQKVAGEKMKKILALLTKNPFFGVIAGIFFFIWYLKEMKEQEKEYKKGLDK